MTRKKPIKIPFTLKLIPWVFPKLEKISQQWATKYFEKIFFTPFRYKTPEKEIEAAETAQLFSVTCSSKRIQCYQWGMDESKPYILFVHGWAGRATQFRRFIEPLNKAGFNVIGFDGPAHGKSEGKRTSIAEFEEVIKAICQIKGLPAGIIAHSFGGGAALYSISRGLNVKKLINIASPTIGDRIIESYLKAIGGSKQTGENFKALVKKKQGKAFKEYTALEMIKSVPKDFNLLLVHDEQDKDVNIDHAKELIKVYPAAHLLTTTGLGHNRILKDDKVIEACVSFLS
jgi:pimeloyl-ACP methyl ester carboxylesterase